MMSFSPFLVAVTFAAGLNAYATVATLGLLARFGLVTLPPKLSLLASAYVIGACAALFLIEFIADKIPLFDLLWNALHTFVRPPIAALLAYGASSHLSPEMRLLTAVIGGIIALAAHSGKTAVRTVVTASPEPLSNIALSGGRRRRCDISDVVCDHAPLLGSSDYCGWLGCCCHRCAVRSVRLEDPCAPRPGGAGKAP